MVPFETFPNVKSSSINTESDFSFLVEPNGFIQWDEHDHVSQKVVPADSGIGAQFCRTPRHDESMNVRPFSLRHGINSLLYIAGF